jgi:hypothetical protein
VLPCGHYTTGETPYKYIDGWYLGWFVYRAFKALRGREGRGPRSGQAQQLGGVEVRALPADGPVQMRPGDAAGGAAQAKRSPVATCWPSFTSMRLRCMEIVNRPRPWSMTTQLPS